MTVTFTGADDVANCIGTSTSTAVATAPAAMVSGLTRFRAPIAAAPAEARAMGVRTLGNVLRDNEQLFDECRKFKDERDALKVRVAELEASLKPFAAEYERFRRAYVEAMGREPPLNAERGLISESLLLSDCRRAAEALAKGERDE